MPLWFPMLFAVAVIFAIYCRYNNRLWYRWAKPLPMLLLLGYYNLHNLFHGNFTKFYGWMTLGLTLGLIGDLLLLYDKLFVVSLTSFLIGHVCYIFSFHKNDWILPEIFLYVLGGLMLVYGIVLSAALIQKKSYKYLIPVIAYILILTLMAAVALNFDWKDMGGWIGAGAILFCISDSVLAWNKFVRPFTPAQIVILSTYYCAQVFIAHGTLAIIGK